MYDIVLTVIFAIAGIAAVTLQRRRVRKQLAPGLELQCSINALSLETAKQETEQLLKERSDWLAEPAQSPVVEYSPSANLFFSTYQSVSEITGFLRIDRQLIQPSKFEGYLIIGSCSGEGPVLFNPNTGEVFDVSADQAPQQGMQFPSIYHFVLFTLKSWCASDE